MSKSFHDRKILILMLLILFFIFSDVKSVLAISNSKIRNYNIGCQAIFTFISSLIEGKVHSKSDILSCLLAGAASGYGFYVSKRMVGEGQVIWGVILANISASLAENVSSGHYPFSYIGYSLGPFRFRYTLPWAKDPQARINVDLSLMQSVAFIYSILKYKNICFRDGLIFFRTNKSYGKHAGETIGIFPSIQYDADELTWRHEIVHAIQGIQIDSIEPSRFFYIKIPINLIDSQNKQFRSSAFVVKNKKNKLRFIKFGRVKNGIFGSINTILLRKQQYDKRWMEIEAYHFAR